MLEMTRVGLHLGQERDRVEALGAERTWAHGELLCRKGVVQRALHVVLSGRAEYAGGWFGPGAHTGELGFLLGVPRTADVVASGPGPSGKIICVGFPSEPTMVGRVIRMNGLLLGLTTTRRMAV